MGVPFTGVSVQCRCSCTSDRQCARKWLCRLKRYGWLHTHNIQHIQFPQHTTYTVSTTYNIYSFHNIQHIQFPQHTAYTVSHIQFPQHTTYTVSTTYSIYSFHNIQHIQFPQHTTYTVSTTYNIYSFTYTVSTAHNIYSFLSKWNRCVPLQCIHVRFPPKSMGVLTPTTFGQVEYNFVIYLTVYRQKHSFGEHV